MTGRVTVHNSLSPRVVVQPEEVEGLPLASGEEYDLIVHPHDGSPFCERVFGRDMVGAVDCHVSDPRTNRVLIAPYGHHEMTKYRRGSE